MSAASDAAVAVATVELAKIAKRFGIEACRVELGGLLVVPLGSASTTISARGVRALLLELPSLDQGSGAACVELRFDHRCVLVFEHGADIALFDLPASRRGRAEIRAAVARMFARVDAAVACIGTPPPSEPTCCT